MADKQQQQQQQQQVDLATLAAQQQQQQQQQTDADDSLQAALRGLRNLSADDKCEVGLLRSRVEDQSHLIMMLKQRSDEHLVRAQALERVNEELQQFKDEAAERLSREIGRYRVLEEQFETLASNHEQLIRFKDEYKQQNEWLQKENRKLRDHVDALIAAKLRDKEEAIGQLRASLAAAEQRLRDNEQRAKEQRRGLEAKVKQLEARAASAEAEAAERTASLRQAEAELANLRSASSADAEAWRLREATLAKEKDEMLQLAMQRGRLCEEKQRDLKATKEKLLDTERRLKELKAKYDSETEVVNSNAAVKKLRAELDANRKALQDLRQEYSAFKQHSGGLLQQERDINAALRNNIG